MQKEIQWYKNTIKAKEQIILKQQNIIDEAANFASAFGREAEDFEDRKLSNKVQGQFQMLFLHLKSKI